jgi:carboxylesterase
LSIWDIERVLSRRLLLWAAVSSLSGILISLLGSTLWRGVGMQALLWGGIDALIALAMGLRARRKSQAESSQGRHSERQRLVRLLWINAGLDVLYIAGGLVLILTVGAGREIWMGHGIGIVVQGIYLFLFDVLHARGLPATPADPPPIQAFQGEEHLSFHLPADASRRNTPAALLIHGFPGTPAEMRPLAESLNGLGWTVEAPLLPGFGPHIRSLMSYGADDWIRAVQESMRALEKKHDPIVLVGYSMGASLCLNAAVARRPAALILLAPFWRMGSRWQRWIGAILRPFLFPLFYPLKNADFSEPKLRESLRGFFPVTDLDDPTVQRDLRGLGVPLSFLDELAQVGRRAYRAAPSIEGPLLIVQGTDDEVVKPDSTRRLVRRFDCDVDFRELSGAHDLVAPTNPSWPEIQEMIVRFTFDLRQEK